jgi:hypothetical protein
VGEADVGQADVADRDFMRAAAQDHHRYFAETRRAGGGGRTGSGSAGDSV